MDHSVTFKLEKAIWTDADYVQMGWHDAFVRGISFNAGTEPFVNEFFLDIDYIFKWVDPYPPSKSFSFFVSPCTLVFHDVAGLRIDIANGSMMLEIEIADIHHEPNSNRWRIDLHVGEISFEASGHTQVVRKLPIHVEGQVLPELERGGVSFSRMPASI